MSAARNHLSTQHDIYHLCCRHDQQCRQPRQLHSTCEADVVQHAAGLANERDLYATNEIEIKPRQELTDQYIKSTYVRICIVAVAVCRPIYRSGPRLSRQLFDVTCGRTHGDVYDVERVLQRTVFGRSSNDRCRRAAVSSLPVVTATAADTPFTDNAAAEPESLQAKPMYQPTVRNKMKKTIRQYNRDEKTQWRAIRKANTLSWSHKVLTQKINTYKLYKTQNLMNTKNRSQRQTDIQIDRHRRRKVLRPLDENEMQPKDSGKSCSYMYTGGLIVHCKGE